MKYSEYELDKTFTLLALISYSPERFEKTSFFEKHPF